jgi:CHAT domain-containing protein/Flp pilus assembly protein TadD
MKRIARIALVAVLLIGGMVRPVWCQENIDKYVQELNSKTTEAFKKGDLQQGSLLAEQAYRYAIEYLGQKHPETLEAEDNMAGVYFYQGYYKKAVDLEKRNFQLRKEVLGDKHKDTLESMAGLCMLYRMLGNYSEAEPLCVNALKFHRETLGENHPDTLESINYLAMLYQAQGHYNKAEPLFKQALQLRENTLGKEDPSTLQSINNLAMLYQDQNRYRESEPLLKEALHLSEKSPEKNRLHTPQFTNNLALLYHKKGNYYEAERLYKKAIEYSEIIFGREKQETLIYLSNLAALYSAKENYNKSEPLYREVLLLKEKMLGKEHPETLLTMHGLAFSYIAQGRYSEAEQIYKEMLPSVERKMGVNHPYTLSLQVNYILLLVNTNRPAMALRLLQEYEHRLLSRSFNELYDSSSEKERRQYLVSINYFQQFVFSLANHIPEEKYQQYAAEVMLRWKQIYAEERHVQYQLLNLSDAPQVTALRTQHTTIKYKTGQRVEKQNIDELIKRFNQDEAAMLSLIRRLRTNLEVENVTLERVQSALPPNSGLIEYRVANLADITNINKLISDKRNGKQELHLVSFLLLADKNTKQYLYFRDLGKVEEVFNLIKNFWQLEWKISYIHHLLQEKDPPKDADYLQALAEALEEKVGPETTGIYRAILFPFEEQIKNLKQLYIAPDLFLNLLSFASLRLPDGRFLAERQQINQLQTGRDLIENGKDFPRGKGLVAIGGAKYVRDSMPAGKTEPAQTLVAYQQRAVRELAEGIEYLPESRKEALKIGEIFTKNTGEKPTVLIGDDASEYSLKHLKQPPRILHLSTHGFYLGDDKKEDGLTEQLRDEAPLLLSGLALAGANNWLQGRVVDSHGDDGLLYSLEVLGLNLHGTELVSLSACDTGKGVLDYSEGVYGLVRAFRTAGAKNVLMTLTPVGDASSRDFMETFYDKWLSSEKNISPAEALHQTRLDFIHDGRPVKDWAPYVLVGK